MKIEAGNSQRYKSAIIWLNNRWIQSDMDENEPTNRLSSISIGGRTNGVRENWVGETAFYPDLIRIKIAASEADFEAGELWGRKASAASFSFPKFPSLKISLGGRNLNPFTFGIESSFSNQKVYDSNSAPRIGNRREGSSRPVFVHIWVSSPVYKRNNWNWNPKFTFGITRPRFCQPPFWNQFLFLPKVTQVRTSFQCF